MIDILVLSTEADEPRTDALMTALKSTGVTNTNRVRIRTVVPDDRAAWEEVVELAEKCPCVLFCWSAQTGRPEMAPFHKLGATVFKDGRAVSVELDEGTRPKEMRTLKPYPLFGWRARPRWWHLFIFGQSYVTQIAAAAEQKALGKDPPLPSAFSRMVWQQALVVGALLVAAIGVSDDLLSLFDRVSGAQWRHPEMGAAFDSALASPQPCIALRDFANSHPKSAWQDEVTDRLLTCRDQEFTDTVPVSQTLVVFGATRADAEREAATGCRERAALTGASLRSVQVDHFEPAGRSTAKCALDEPRLRTKEVMGSRKD